MIPFSVVGPTGGHKSPSFNSEATKNLYLDASDSGRQGLHDLPGLKPLSTGLGPDRGAHVMKERLYCIQGTNLRVITSNGTATTLGTISGDGRAVFADDGTNLYFTVNQKLYKYDGSSLSEVTQTVVNSPFSIAYINRQFVLTGTNGLFTSSDVANGSSYNALNVAEAEVSPDELRRVYVFNQLVYMLGVESCELWYNSGVGSPPFDRQDTALVNVGIAGTHAVTNTDQYMYWLSDDRKIYQCVGASARQINTAPISNAIEPMGLISDCVASTWLYNGQDFVVFAFPHENRTFMYSEQLKYWIEATSGVYQDRWYANSVIQVYGKPIGFDWRSGTVYELDPDTYTDNGDPRIRVRIVPTFTSALTGIAGQKVIVKRVKINMQTGQGLTTGQGSNPVAMCELSNDGGHTWSAETFVPVGVNGNYYDGVDYYAFSVGYEVRLKITFSDPVYFSLFDGFVDIEAAGW